MSSENINVEVLYFGRLGEELACTNENLELKNACTIKQLIETLVSRGGNWRLIEAPEVRRALNQNLDKQNTVLKDGDEIAFFPPVTGG